MLRLPSNTTTLKEAFSAPLHAVRRDDDQIPLLHTHARHDDARPRCDYANQTHRGYANQFREGPL